MGRTVLQMHLDMDQYEWDIGQQDAAKEDGVRRQMDFPVGSRHYNVQYLFTGGQFCVKTTDLYIFA